MPKKCLRCSLASMNCLAMVGKSNPSVRSLWTLRSNYVVEALLGHSRFRVGFDASDGRKGPFPSCSGNRGCEIDPHQFKLSTSLNMLEASGAATSMFARVRTLVTLEALSGQLFRRSGSKRSCLSCFLMSMSLLYKS